MGKYLPFAGKNSIAEMSVAIQFASTFDAKIQDSVESIKAEFKNELPKFEPLHLFTFNFGLPQFQGSTSGGTPSVSGLNLIKPKTDGSAALVLRVVSNVISIHFLEYTSWKETKPQAISYVVRCLEKLGVMNLNPAVSVLLRYIDRFTFDGEPKDAKASQLFRSDTLFVPAKILDAGYAWHANSGWFEPLVGTSPALNQLNVSSSMIQATVGAVGVIVDHNNAFNLPSLLHRQQS